MKRWRTIALGSGAVVIAALAAAVAVHTLVAPERLVQKAREKAQAAWSRNVEVGAAELRLWPVPTLRAENVALANPTWAKAPYLLQAEGVSARLELLPLLLGKVRFKSLELEGVKASFEVAADGARSWDLKGAPADTSVGGLQNLTSLDIRNANIAYRPQGTAATLWHLEEASAQSEAGLRDVRIEAKGWRNRLPVQLQAELADLSHLGEARATSDGKIDFQWGKARFIASGRLALNGDLEGETQITDVVATLGKLRVTGSGTWSQSGARRVLRAKLETDRLDWVQALLDAGGPPLPPLPAEELFHDNDLAWPLLSALKGVEGVVDLKLGSLKLRNGVELTNAVAHVAIDGERLNMSSFSTQLLGGSAKGSMLFDARKKSVKVNLEGTNLLLERWFRERGSVIPFTGGPMRLTASLAASGKSMKALAASSTGPVVIRMGRGVWASPKAGHAEDVMVRSFSNRESQQIDLECVTAALAFVAGRAAGKNIVGARSTAASLLTSGVVDLRDETLDLRGPVRGNTGSVGLATIADDMKITGPIRRPKASIDAAGTPKAIARAGAAILTAGASLVGTAAANAKKARESDPCQAVIEGSTVGQLAAFK